MMYGVVLLMAITVGSETADRGRKGKGCCGCQGSYASCYGGGGCYGGGCYGGGCYGGYAGGGYGGGCYGGGYGVPSGGKHHWRRASAVETPSNAATMVVTLPEDATLTIEGQATTSTSSVRTFLSPELTPGKVYSYTLEASYQKEGKTVKVSKKVKVEPGKVFTIDLLETAPATGVASN